MPGIAFQNSSQKYSLRNRSPVIKSFTSSKSSIDLCPTAPGGSCSSGTIVTLKVKANDPDKDRLTYKFSVSQGALLVNAATASWDLTKAFGKQTARVDVVDQHGAVTTRTLQVDVVACEACHFICPVITVSCPATVPQDEILSFQATVGGGDLPEKLTFFWSHTNGKLLPAQNGPALRIRAVGLVGDVITATVRVAELDPTCNVQASCESRIVQSTRH